MDPPAEWALCPHVAAELYASQQLGYAWLPSERGGLPSLVWSKVEQSVVGDLAVFAALMAAIKSGELLPAPLA